MLNSMFILEFGLAAFLVILIVRHGSRIASLEAQVKILTSSKKSPAPEVQTSRMNVMMESPVVVPQAEVATPSSSVAPQTVGGEEGSGRLLGKIGIAALIIGVAFFLKYTFDNNWVGPVGRVMIGIIGGIGLLGIGQFLRAKYVRYSDMLMGGGIAIVYLSLFSAHFFYNLISPQVTWGSMFLVTLLAFAISIVNATPTLAMISVIGGFATPFLVSSGGNMMMSLFGYITILNFGILCISIFKKWPQLIAAAFAGTYIVFTTWFTVYYTPAVLTVTLVFISTSFLIFLCASVVRSVSAKSTLDQLNYVLLGVNALVFAAIGYQILHPAHHSILGFSAVLVAVVYIIAALVVNKSNPEDRALNIFLPGLAVTFLSLAVPLQFSGSWIAVAWFAESIVLYIIASTIGNRGFQVMGVVVYVLGLFNFFLWNFPNINDQNFTLFFNSHFIILVFAVCIAYAITFMYYRYGSLTVETQQRGIVAFLIIANVLSLYALSSQIVFYHNAASMKVTTEYKTTTLQAQTYGNGYDTSGQLQEASQRYNTKIQSITNRSHTYVSILWAVYAAVLTIVGFSMRLLVARRLGLALFIITAIKVIFDVWSLGQLYRIVSFLAFGVIALAASFAYVKYKDRLKEIV